MQVRHSEFLAEHLGEWPGPIVDQDTGAVLGYHRGFWFHTIGQRKGVRSPKTDNCRAPCLPRLSPVLYIRTLVMSLHQTHCKCELAVGQRAHVLAADTAARRAVVLRQEGRSYEHGLCVPGVLCR